MNSDRYSCIHKLFSDVKGAGTYARLLVKSANRKLLAVETSYFHMAIKKWVTSSCSKYQKVKTNNRIVKGDCTLEIKKTVRSGELLVLRT